MISTSVGVVTAARRTGVCDERRDRVMARDDKMGHSGVDVAFGENY